MDDISIQKAPGKLQTKQLQDEIEDKFIELLFKYRSPREAAIEAGYSETYARSIKSNKLKNPKFLQKIKDHYNGNATLILPDIFQSESKSISLSNKIVSQLETSINDTDDIDQKVELTNKALSILAKSSHTRKELKQTAGVLAQDGAPQINVVNIDKIQALIHNNHKDMIDSK